MRPVDIIGLFAFMVLGLIGLAFWRPIADALASFAGGHRGRDSAEALRASARLLVLIFSLFMAGGSALVALKVLEPRPGRYPGGAGVTVGAIAVLVATAVVFALRVVRPALRRDGTDAGGGARE